jgi:PAS domain S-box-containing protein
MLNIQDLVYIELSIVDEPTYKVGHTVPVEDAWSQSFNLEYINNGKIISIGQLNVVADRSSLDKRVLGRMFEILFSEAIQMLLLAGIILYIIERLLVRPLKQIVRYTGSLDLDNLEEPLVIKRRKMASEQDELAQVVLTLNKMRCRLMDHMAERKIAADALKQSELKFKELFDDAPVGYHEINTEGIITQVNKRELEILGYSIDEMINNYIWNFVADSEFTQNEIKEKLAGNKKMGIGYERTFIRKDKILIPVLIEDKLIRNLENEVIGIRSTIQNISERKRYEIKLHHSNLQLEQALSKLKETQKMFSQQERLRSLGQLASGIAHDINNSLTPIMGYVDLLSQDEELMKREAKTMNRIIKSTKDIARTIGRLREFYKVKMTDKDLEEININKIIDVTIDLTKHKWKNIAESSGAIIEIKKEFADNLPLTLGDESELTEALTNLILNACDAMPGGGTLTFRTYLEDNRIVIQIIDSGFGMNEVVLKQCMNPFFTTKGEKGSGLGLVMVHGIIERHRGDIKIESELNRGTCISLILPINNVEIQAVEIDDNIIFNRPLHILCVEDQISINDMVKQIMESNGHLVTQAPEGQVGLELFSKSFNNNNPFDLVITDLGMPGLDGYTFSKKIKKLCPNVPIILLTGWGSLINKEDYPTVDYILNKPIMMKDLQKVINELFRNKKNNSK